MNASHSQHPPQDHARQSPPGPGRGDFNVTWTAIAMFLGAIVIFVFIVAVQILFQRTTRQEFQQKIVAEVPEELAQLQAQQLERIHTYRLVDAKAGIAAIPIEQAMALVARNPGIRPVAASTTQTQPVDQTQPVAQTQVAGPTQPAGQTQPAATQGGASP